MQSGTGKVGKRPVREFFGPYCGCDRRSCAHIAKSIKVADRRKARKGKGRAIAESLAS